MSATTQQPPIQNFDIGLLDQLRHECELHTIDMSRVKIVQVGTDGRYSVEFDRPLCDIERFCPGAPSQLSARSAHQAEGLMLLWSKRIQVGERQAVRHGVVCGWDTAKINRTPISADELDRYRARLKETELQRRITAELIAAVEERQQEANQNAQDELLARYPQSVQQPRKAKPLPAPTLPGVPTKRTHRSTAK